MGSFAPVRRNNNRKAVSPTGEYDSVSKQSNGAILPLHHRNANGNGGKISSAPNGIGKRKRTRRGRNKPFYCIGVPVDIPVVGVVTILFVGAMLVVIGSTSLLHASATVGSNSAEHRFQHHLERQNVEQQHAKHNSKTNRHQDEEEDSRRLHQEAPIASRHQQVAEEPEVVVLPSSPVRVVYNVEKETIFDVVVAGAGPSGLTAALFASRAGLRVHVLGSASTGLLSQTKRLDNFPSFVGEKSGVLTGPDWLKDTLEQAKSWGAIFGPPGLLASSIEQQRISVQDKDGDDAANTKNVFFSLSTGGDDTPIRAWSVIVATGATPRKLGLAGEEPLWGNSLHSCAICDGHLYQGTQSKPSTVLVVGGGDAALDAALLLARYATKVVLVHRREEFTSAHNLASLDAVRATTNIEIMIPYTVEEWITKENDPSQLVGARLSSPGNSRRHIDIDGAFVMIGASPNTQWMNNAGVTLDEEGLIQTTANLPKATKSTSMITASSVPGLFAAGEVTDNIYKQAITAAAAGAQAAIDAERWLREQRGVTGSINAISGGGSQQVGDSTNNKLEKMEPVENDVGGASDHGDTQNDDGAHVPENCELVSEDCIRSIVNAYPVVVFSKPWCPYCRKALEALSLVGVSEQSGKLLVIDLSKHADTQEIQATLQAMTGRRTVPNVFVDGKSIGGGDETRSFQQSGKLVPMLRDAGALGDGKSSSSQAEIAAQRRNVKQDEESIKEAKKTTIVKKQPTRHSSSETESCDLLSEDCAREIVHKYPVVLFSLSWCPECKRSLELLDLMGIKQDQIHIIDLDDYPEIALDIRANMKALSGRRSVPNLFIGGENFGGFVKTQERRDSGELVAKFREVGVLPS